MIKALAVNEKDLKTIFSVLSPEFQSQLKGLYPGLFVTHKVGNRYKDSEGNRYVLAHESGHVAMVNVDNGSILATVRVGNVNNVTEEEMERVYSGKEMKLVKEAK